MTSESDTSEVVETRYPPSSAVQDEGPGGAMVISHQRGHLVEEPFLCSAKLTVASCSAQPHENFGEELKIQS